MSYVELAHQRRTLARRIVKTDTSLLAKISYRLNCRDEFVNHVVCEDTVNGNGNNDTPLPLPRSNGYEPLARAVVRRPHH